MPEKDKYDPLVMIAMGAEKSIKKLSSLGESVQQDPTVQRIRYLLNVASNRAREEVRAYHQKEHN